MNIVSVINYKGGVGKTTLTANLAAELAWRNYRVLLIDLDAQASLTFSFIPPEVWKKDFADTKTIKSWFDSFESSVSLPLSDLIHTPSRVAERLKGKGKLDIICSHLGLINVDLELATKLGGASLEQAKRNFIRIHRRLADGISEIDSSQYDIILIDCPPNFNIVTKTAIVASDFVLVPARPDYLSTLGIDYLIRSLNGLIKDYNDFANIEDGDKVSKIKPSIMGVVFTMIREYGGEPISSQRPYISHTKDMKQVSVFPHYIKHNNTVFADAPQYGVPLVLHGYSTGTYRSIIKGLENVATDFGRKLGWCELVPLCWTVRQPS